MFRDLDYLEHKETVSPRKCIFMLRITKVSGDVADMGSEDDTLQKIAA